MAKSTFSTLAYLLISISRFPFCSKATVDVASSAIWQARSDLNSIINSKTFYQDVMQQAFNSKKLGNILNIEFNASFCCNIYPAVRR
jgi:hypothetical protein